jgi:hypothetical protein
MSGTALRLNLFILQDDTDMPFSGYQPSFIGGVIGPSLFARIDLGKYAYGCKRLNNMLVYPQGGVFKRPGLRLAGEIDSEAVLIPFVFNAGGQSYVLMFADRKMYVGYEGALLGTDGQPAVFVTPYSLAQAKSLSHAQYADIMYLAHPDLPPYKLMRYGHSDWRFVKVNFNPPPAPAGSNIPVPAPPDISLSLNTEGPSVAPVQAHTYGVTVIDDNGKESRISQAFTVSFGKLGPNYNGSAYITIQASLFTAVTNRTYRLYKQQSGWGFIGQVTGAELVSGLVDSGIPPNLSIQPPVSTTANSALSVTRVGEVSENTGLKDYYWAYTTVDQAGNESLLGGETSASSRYLIEGSYWQLTIPYNAGALEYRLYKKRAGSYGYIGSVLEEDRSKGFVDENINPDLTKGPPRKVELFQAAGDYPSLVCFYQQRLLFAASYNNPQTVWMSRSNKFENFSNSVPVVDDGAIEITMASSEVSMPVWLKTLRSLILGTSSGVWEIAAKDEIFTPSNLSCTIQSYRGCQAVRPVVVGNRLLYVMTGGRQVYEMAYDFGSDSYADNECSILAPHLFEGRQVTAMAYQADPWSVVWLAMSDGKLLSLTFIKEQEVYAWASHDTQGEIKSLCVLPERGREKFYALVKRGDKFFLEVMTEGFSGGEVSQAFYLDCGLSLESETSFSLVKGLDHLEGKEVAVLADGAAHPPQTVTGGEIRLQHPAKSVHVGLSYAGEMETLPLQVSEPGGSSIGMLKRIHAVNVMFYQTVTCKVGRGDVLNKPLDESAWRTVEPYGAPIVPATTTKLIRLAGGWAPEATLRFVSDKPLPLTILSLAPEFDIASGR